MAVPASTSNLPDWSQRVATDDRLGDAEQHYVSWLGRSYDLFVELSNFTLSEAYEQIQNLTRIAAYADRGRLLDEEARDRNFKALDPEAAGWIDDVCAIFRELSRFSLTDYYEQTKNLDTVVNCARRGISLARNAEPRAIALQQAKSTPGSQT